MTAGEILAQIEKNFFKGAGLSKACKLSGEDRKSYVLAQVERLLATMYGSSPLAVHLSDQFWTADEGRKIMYENDPLFSMEERASLTDKETARLELILEIAGLCHDIGLYQRFDLKQVLGIRNKWWVSNKRLVEWLTTTEYEHIAMCVAYIMRKQAISAYEDAYYYPAQDELARIFSSKFGQMIEYPKAKEIPPRDYVQIILNELLRVYRHWKRGRILKLNPEEIIIHDEIYGLVPYQFSSGIVKAAKELYDYMDKEVKGSLIIEGCNTENLHWSDQPESVRSIITDVLERFAAKVREVRDKDFAEGWLKDDSLSFNYLIAHAERCGQGHWNEEDITL